MLEWLDTSRLAVWLSESPSIWSLPTVLTLHTTGLALLVGASWVLDLRLLGLVRTIPLSAFHWVFRVVTIGLVVNIITGVMLFIKNASTWGHSLPFLVKMSLVVAGCVTLVPIRAHVLRGSAADGSARVWAIASIFTWSAAVTAGRLLAYLQV